MTIIEALENALQSLMDEGITEGEIIDDFKLAIGRILLRHSDVADEQL